MRYPPAPLSTPPLLNHADSLWGIPAEGRGGHPDQPPIQLWVRPRWEARIDSSELSWDAAKEPELPETPRFRFKSWPCSQIKAQALVKFLNL